MGRNHQGPLLVMTAHATLHTHLHKLPNKKSNTVSQYISSILNNVIYPVHTLSIANDQVIAEHQALGITRNQALQKNN